MTTTRMLRWRPVEPPPRFAYKVYETGDAGEWGGLVQIVYRGRAENQGWTAECRMERNSGMVDGWLWGTIVIAAIDGPRGPEVCTRSEREIRALVADHWDAIEDFARDYLHRATTPAAGQDAADGERERQTAEGLITTADSPLATVAGSLAAVEPPVEADDGQITAKLLMALHDHYMSEVDAVAARLREAADKIQRRPVAQSIRDMRLDYASHAGEVLDTLRTMTGNIAYGSLVRAARDVDLAVRDKAP